MVSLLLVLIYMAFISLGLPDGLLGAAWPTMYPVMEVSVSYAGVVSMIIAAGTIVSSLQSDRLTLKWGTGVVTAVSVAITAVSLFGFSFCTSFWQLCLWAIPYGLGAGGVDASINNYVALHYSSRHMSWLHGMWGIGATVGPYIMGFVLSGGFGWENGYRVVGIVQVVLTALLFISLPLWRAHSKKSQEAQEVQGCAPRQPMPLREVIRIPGAKAIMTTFFCYCSIESTAGLWAASYLHLYKGVDTITAAAFGGMFYLGVTAGRFLSGFVTMRLNDTQMIWLGQGIMGAGIVVMLLPGTVFAPVGLVILGLGCAPVYPCIIHSTPERFGADRSGALIGVQMASAYIGSCLMPPVFGLIADYITVALFPVFMLVVLVLMLFMFYRLTRIKQEAL